MSPDIKLNSAISAMVVNKFNRKQVKFIILKCYYGFLEGLYGKFMLRFFHIEQCNFELIFRNDEEFVFRDKNFF